MEIILVSWINVSSVFSSNPRRWHVLHTDGAQDSFYIVSLSPAGNNSWRSVQELNHKSADYRERIQEPADYWTGARNQLIAGSRGLLITGTGAKNQLISGTRKSAYYRNRTQKSADCSRVTGFPMEVLTKRDKNSQPRTTSGAGRCRFITTATNLCPATICPSGYFSTVAPTQVVISELLPLLYTTGYSVSWPLV